MRSHISCNSAGFILFPPGGGIGGPATPASGVKDIFARCLRTLAAGEGELRQRAQANIG